jgi:DNA-binding IclR family transcriptional regulator
VAVRDPDGVAVAGLSVSMPSVRYEPRKLPPLVATLRDAGQALEADLAATR